MIYTAYLLFAASKYNHLLFFILTKKREIIPLFKLTPYDFIDAGPVCRLIPDNAAHLCCADKSINSGGVQPFSLIPVLNDGLFCGCGDAGSNY